MLLEPCIHYCHLHLQQVTEPILIGSNDVVPTENREQDKDAKNVCCIPLHCLNFSDDN